jgi:cell division protein FtsZ
MTLNLTIPQQMHTDFSPRITVIGVGGAGTNAVDNMIALNLQGVEFVVANTDAQQLMHSRADRRIQLGPHITQGLGAGAKPDVGRASAEEAADELYRHLDGAHMVFITAGMGGGTGTGAAPVIARMAREKNILTVGVVTKPFTFEGLKRMRAAEEGIANLQQYVDTLIVIPNQNLFRQANERTGFKEAFKMADNVLYMGVRGVTDLMMAPGLINLDFADIRTVMAEMGKAMMGTGEADGENRAIRAAEAAISNPLLEDTSMAGARGLLINITGGDDMTLFEVDQAANRIREEVDEEANIIFGASSDDALAGRIRVSVVATGIESVHNVQAAPKLVAMAGGGTPTNAVAQPGPTLSVVPGGGNAPTARGPQSSVIPNLPLRGFAQPAPLPQAAPIVTPAPAHSRAPEPTVEAEPQTHAEPIPVIDDTPAPPRGVPPHLRQPVTARPTPQPGKRAPASLFSEPPAEPVASNSIFKQMTGLLFRGANTPVATPQPTRTEPTAHAPEPEAPAADPAPQTANPNLDIPAFLRRQGSQPRRD